MLDHLCIEWDPAGDYCGTGYRPPLLVIDKVHSRADKEGGEHHHKACGSFECAWCRRVLPWCRGEDGSGLVAHLCRRCAAERRDYIKQLRHESEGSILIGFLSQAR